MGRAIGIVFLIVVCSFAFVLLQLRQRRPAGASTQPGPAPVLDIRDDGSVYALRLELDRFEQRLVAGEEQSRKLLTEVEALRQEREGLLARIDDMQGEIRRLRRQVSPRPAQPAPQPPNAPPANGPATPLPQPPVEGTQ
jgi:hypothetical protein